MHIPPRFCEERWHMTRSTAPFSSENRFPANGSLCIEISSRRPGGRNRELIEMERSELGRNDVIGGSDIVIAVLHRERKGISVAKTWIIERALPVHFEVRNENIPVGDASPSGVSMQVDARES